MIIDELFEAPQQCPECGGISFSNLILAEKKDACYHKVKASAKVWPSAYASGRLVQCRKKGAANYGNKSEGVMEMDKSQTPPGRDGSNDPDAGKKEYTAKTITPEKVAKDGEKILNKIFNKKKGVAEDNLKEFAPGNGGGESGRWYTDDQMTDLVGDGWWNDLDISGDISKQEMIQEAQAWLDDQGYSVHVLNCKVNDDDMEWYIEGSFQNSRFAKKGVAEEYELAGVGVAYELGRRAYQERKTIRDNPYSATREARKYDEWEKGFERGKHDANDAKLFRRSVGENAGQPLSVQQLATISDAALDKAYGYGRSQPGNSFGWQANLKSAAFAKQIIDKGVTEFDDTAKFIEAISDAIHKGWNTTAQAFVQDPEQFDDRKNETLKLQKKSPDKSPEEIAQEVTALIEKKRAQRAQLMKQNYAQLPEEEKEKDRVVARALLQAIRGEQQPGMAEGYVPINIYKGPTNPAPKPKKVEPKHKYVDNQVEVEKHYQAREKYFYNVVGKFDGKVINPEPIKGLRAAEEFMKQNGLGGGNTDIEQISTIRFHATGVDASGKRVVSEPLTDMKDVRNFYKQHGIDQFASTTDLTTTDDGSVAEGQLELNTPDPVVVVQDLKGKILDKINLSVAAQKYKLGPPQNIKTQLAHQNYTTIGNYVIVSPMSGQPQDQTTTGQKQAFTATEGEQQPGADYRDPKEVDYDDEYDAMVARVKKLAGLGPMKTVYDPARRQYRNMPTAVQPKK